MNQVELPAGFGQTRGSEHEVWFANDGRVIKATHPGEFGRLFGPDRFATLDQYMERIRLTVELFGLDWQIHGLHGSGRNARVVTSQPIFLGKPATRQEIAAFMRERRFVLHRTMIWRCVVSQRGQRAGSRCRAKECGAWQGGTRAD